MAERKIKNMQELSKVLDVTQSKLANMILRFQSGSEEAREEIEAILKKQEKQLDNKRKYLELLKDIKEFSDDHFKTNSEISKLIGEKKKGLEKVLDETGKWDRALGLVNNQLKQIVRQNEEIFRISHDIQLEANLTWKEYTKLFEASYEASRRLRREIGQSVFVAKDLIETQNRLLGTGWKDIRVQDLTNVSTQVALMQRTLGDLDERLVTTLQMSYRLFGEETDVFIHELGNRLNAFSQSFGLHVGTLQSAVAEMMASNSFVARSNMQTQIAANESLMRAVALAGNVGLSTSTFLTDLYKTAMFGTVEEMTPLYQAGALIQGFDVGDFQRRTVEGDYFGAAEDLIAGIGRTFENVTDHYLRAEYMRQIGGAFGLSRDDILQITTNAESLGAYTEKIAEKFEGIDTSMVDELAGLKMDLSNRWENWWFNTQLSKKLGGVLQEYGLFGMIDPVISIRNAVWAIATGQVFSNKALSKIAMGSLAKVGGVGTLAKTAGMVGGGALILGGSQLLGSQIMSNTNISDKGAILTSGILNIGGGIAGGALIGTKLGAVGGIPGMMIGAGVGGVAGGILGGVNTYRSHQERQSQLAEFEEQGRERSRASTEAVKKTGDATVDAINQLIAEVRKINGSVDGIKETNIMLNMRNRTTTEGAF